MIPWSASRIWAISSPTTYDGRVYVRIMRNDNASTNAVNATRCDPCDSSQFEYGTSDAIAQGPATTYTSLSLMTPTQHGQRRISTSWAYYSPLVVLQWAIRSQDTYHKPWVCSTISQSDSSAT